MLLVVVIAITISSSWFCLSFKGFCLLLPLLCSFQFFCSCWLCLCCLLWCWNVSNARAVTLCYCCHHCHCSIWLLIFNLTLAYHCSYQCCCIFFYCCCFCCLLHCSSYFWHYCCCCLLLSSSSPLPSVDCWFLLIWFYFVVASNMLIPMLLLLLLWLSLMCAMVISMSVLLLLAVVVAIATIPTVDCCFFSKISNCCDHSNTTATALVAVIFVASLIVLPEFFCHSFDFLQGVVVPRKQGISKVVLAIKLFVAYDYCCHFCPQSSTVVIVLSSNRSWLPLLWCWSLATQFQLIPFSVCAAMILLLFLMPVLGFDVLLLDIWHCGS